MSFCLTQEEIEEFTGYRRKAEQIRELARRGVDFDVSANRKLIVVRSRIEGTTAEERYREEPILDEI